MADTLILIEGITKGLIKAQMLRLKGGLNLFFFWTRVNPKLRNRDKVGVNRIFKNRNKVKEIGLILALFVLFHIKNKGLKKG